MKKREQIPKHLDETVYHELVHNIYQNFEGPAWSKIIYNLYFKLNKDFSSRLRTEILEFLKYTKYDN